MPDNAEAISAIWEVICAERVYTAVNRPFSPEQEREYIASLSEREGYCPSTGPAYDGFRPRPRL